MRFEPVSQSEFRIDWAGREWRLRVDEAIPGLRCETPVLGPLLGLEGLAESGRCSRGVLCSATLTGIEQRFTRVEATYAPLGWGAIEVRAAWQPVRDGGIELEIQVQARTVGRLKSLEVTILSSIADPPAPGSHRSVVPRDARSAALSYDGRERDLAALTTGPPEPAPPPWLVPDAGLKGLTYVELALAGDFSRCILEGKLPFRAARHCLFGHDLEKGVVLRARIRSYWLPKVSVMSETERLYDLFCNEPLPLST